MLNFFLSLTVFSKALLDFIIRFPVIAMQNCDLTNNIIANKIFLVMILMIYLTSEWSRSKSDFVVAVLQRGHWMPIFHKLVWFFRVFVKGLQHTLVKMPQWLYKTTPLYTLFCSQWLVSRHVPLNANELCSLHPSLQRKRRRFANNH